MKYLHKISLLLSIFAVGLFASCDTVDLEDAQATRLAKTANRAKNLVKVRNFIRYSKSL